MRESEYVDVQINFSELPIKRVSYQKREFEAMLFR